MRQTLPEDGNADSKLTSPAEDPTDPGATSAESDVEERAAPETLSIDSVLEVLSNQRRRYIVSYLADADEVVGVGELTDSVTAFENDVSVDEVSPKERKRVYVALYQCHLPMLDDHRVIEFDKDQSQVGPDVHFSLVHGNLRTLEGSRSRGDDDTTESGQLVVFTGVLMAGGLALLLSSLILADRTLSGIGIALLSAVIAWVGFALSVWVRE